jgi:hypothetical protein
MSENFLERMAREAREVPKREHWHPMTDEELVVRNKKGPENRISAQNER